MLPDTTWRGLFELLNDVALKEDADSMLDAFFEDVDDVVPAECGVAMFEMRDGRPHCIRWPDYSDPLVPAFNSHFNGVCPEPYDWKAHTLGPVSWRAYSDSQYDCEFNRPLSIGHSIGVGFYDPLRELEIIICTHRGRNDPPFRDKDATALAEARGILQRLVFLSRRAEMAERDTLLPVELAPGASRLSRREAEVAQLLLRRLSMRRIAERLGISPRTVESHALHIYQKLGVSGREALVEQTRALYMMGGRQGPSQTSR